MNPSTDIHDIFEAAISEVDNFAESSDTIGALEMDTMFYQMDGEREINPWEL